MKILGVEDLIGIDYKEVNDLTNEIVRDWPNEKTFFNSLIHSPDFERPVFQELIKRTDEVHQLLSKLKQSFIPPQGSKINSSHPSQFGEDKKSKLLVEKIQVFIENYQALDDYRIGHSSVGRLEEKFLTRISELEESVFGDAQKRIDELTTTVRDDIKTGIDKLLNLKSELGLAEQFGEKIQNELKAAKKKEFLFMSAFIVTLLVIFPIVLLQTYSFAHDVTNKVDVSSAYILQGSVSIPLLIISLFFFSQYRTYMMIRLRYTHLDGFLGGGATFLSQLLESDNPEFKLEINKKLAELFMSLDDVLKMVQKSKHPAELTLETAESVFDKLSKFKKS